MSHEIENKYTLDNAHINFCAPINLPDAKLYKTGDYAKIYNSKLYYYVSNNLNIIQ